VGADELDPKENRISVDSPMAKSILGKRVDDEIRINNSVWIITNIHYSAIN
jgi:transcription elongation factor GreB